ncbi:T9SS type A sorting domain-containing protein [Chryseobacterium sp. PMSZPI]|uniref:T9SS type A sorting domain-containing protein n=1 Tax=Chryseobacterium sp. PMSZPI TaxID=1033900 RepID=UPI000C33E21C|nr:T9SS type A sorting domain-containing protein [Chryseobacterium sp. PMSZPI]PKF72921.1 hypothetical protein CW752_15145 [Chryseobacterium sp. PMSZPI]
MLENLFFVVRRLNIGIVGVIIFGNIFYAQQGTSQNCNNMDPGNNSGDIGCVSFTYQGQLVTYTTVRAADGKVWLQQNLGSSRVATSTDDEKSYGDLFQWGRWDDGHQLRGSALIASPSINTPEGISNTTSFVADSPGWWSINAASDEWIGKNSGEITGTVGIDPCKAIGTEWKMPSQADWAEIVSVEHINQPNRAQASNLRLPMGGYRSSIDGGFTFVGKRGYFWSADTALSGGKYLYIGSVSANASSGAPRGQGASVRCIKTTSTLGISDIRLKANAEEIYPNPTKGMLTIKSDAAIEQINVVNAIGQRINVEFLNNQINMNQFPKGVYFIELKLKNGKSVSRKIIKD